MSAVPDFLKRKSAARKRAAADNTVIADLAANADLPTTVAKVNALLAALRSAGITKAS